MLLAFVATCPPLLLSLLAKQQEKPFAVLLLKQVGDEAAAVETI
jgi:hypothetical protein